MFLHRFYFAARLVYFPEEKSLTHETYTYCERTLNNKNLT